MVQNVAENVNIQDIKKYFNSLEIGLRVEKVNLIF